MDLKSFIILQILILKSSARKNCKGWFLQFPKQFSAWILIVSLSRFPWVLILLNGLSKGLTFRWGIAGGMIKDYFSIEHIKYFFLHFINYKVSLILWFELPNDTSFWSYTKTDNWWQVSISSIKAQVLV